MTNPKPIFSKLEICGLVLLAFVIGMIAGANLALWMVLHD